MLTRNDNGSCLLIIVFWVGLILIVGFITIRKYNLFPLRQSEEGIVFAGKIVNSKTGEWSNDRLVIVYLHGKEIGRAISTTDEFAENNLGVQDGLFIIPISNTYKLNADDFTVDGGTKLITGTYSRGTYTINGYRFSFCDFNNIKLCPLIVYNWFELEEGSQLEIGVPTKNLEYIVKSIAGDKSTLPPQLLTADSTHLTKDSEIVVSLPEDNLTQAKNISLENISGINDFQYTDIETKTVILKKLSHPVRNCVSSTLTTVFSTTQTIAYQYQIEASGEVGAAVTLPISVIELQLFAALQAKYGFEEGQIETEMIAYRIEAKPHTNQVYYFTLKEVWESGQAKTAEGEITVPFRVKTDLIYDVDSQELGCN